MDYGTAVIKTQLAEDLALNETEVPEENIQVELNIPTKPKYNIGDSFIPPKLQTQVIVSELYDETPLKYETVGASGFDLRADIKEPIFVSAKKTALIPTGIKIAVPLGFELQVRPRSGLALKNDITVLNTPGTVDADYRGEVCVILRNHGDNPFVVNRGDRIAQGVIVPIIQADFKVVDELPSTERGTGGFGSTGVQ